jgi:hypothetical protein
VSRPKKSISTGSPLSIPISGSLGDPATYTHEYMLRPPKRGLTEEEKQDLQERFDELMAEKRNGFKQKVAREEMTENEAADALMHEVLSQLASEFGIGYCRIVKRHGFESGAF